MANRPVFKPFRQTPFYAEFNTEFQYCSGFSLKQRQRSIHNLHQAYLVRFPEEQLLEISSKSENPLGVSLSAFNLTVETKSHGAKSVETLYQAGKVFSDGKDNLEILNMTSAEAKKYIKTLAVSPLRCFRLEGREFSTEPRNFFYDWLYLTALTQHPELGSQLMEYQGFTDIVFNPAKSANCQARAAAVYVAMVRYGLLEEAMESPENYLKLVFGV